MSDSKHQTNSIGFTGFLALIFITLKLCNVITWSWWWVLSPFWIPLCLVLLILVGFGIYLLIAAIMKGGKR